MNGTSIHVDGREANRIRKLTADLQVETVMTEETKETWAEKIVLLGKKEKV